MLILSTPGGSIQLPVFMPVGTNASVKALSREDLESLGVQIILANNYHLYLHPSGQTISRLGGLHAFMNWPRPILTDSGGFQVLSLGSKSSHRLVSVSENGISFRSHRDGSAHFWTPESAIEHQFLLGSDIVMPLDIPTPHQASYSQAKANLRLTHLWLARCLARYRQLCAQLPPNPRPLLFGIAQGGFFKDLRRHSAEFILSHSLPGLALGGESIGHDISTTLEVFHWVKDLIPPGLPVYAMGLGAKPSDLSQAFAAGIHMADCVAPARLARHGLLYVSQAESATETINISKSIYKSDPTPISPGSPYSRAYLHHLFKTRELLYYRLATLHNLGCMLQSAK